MYKRIKDLGKLSTTFEPGMHLEDISCAHQTGHSPLESDNVTIPSHGIAVEGSGPAVDEGYFSHIHDTGRSCSSEELPCGFDDATPTGRPTQHQSQVFHLRINDLSVQETSIISMLQEQQALLQQVLSTQKNVTEKQLDKELGILKEKFVNEESVSTSSSSGGTSGKRKSTVSRTLSVSYVHELTPPTFWQLVIDFLLCS